MTRLNVTFNSGLLLWYVISQSWNDLSILHYFTLPVLPYFPANIWTHQGHRTMQQCLVPNGCNGSGHHKGQTLESLQEKSPHPFCLHISVLRMYINFQCYNASIAIPIINKGSCKDKVVIYLPFTNHHTPPDCSS